MKSTTRGPSKKARLLQWRARMPGTVRASRLRKGRSMCSCCVTTRRIERKRLKVVLHERGE